MLNYASFDDINNFVKTMISIKTEDDVNKAFNYFVNRHEFQNEYNIKQLPNMIHSALMRNYKAQHLLLKLSMMLMEKYDIIVCYMLPMLSLHKGCVFEKIHKNNKKTNKITKEYAGFEINFDNNDVINVYGTSNDLLFTITIKKYYIGNMVITQNSAKTLKCEINGQNLLSIKFNDIDDLYNRAVKLETDKTPFKLPHEAKDAILLGHRHRKLNEIETAIKFDNIDDLQKLLAVKDNWNEITCKIDIPIYEISMNRGRRNKGFTLSDTALFYGSVKCFKYLLMNNAIKTTRFTVDAVMFGYNTELIWLLIQNELINTNAIDTILESVIKYCDVELFTFWYQRYGISNAKRLLEVAMENYNYDIIKFIMEEKLYDISKIEIYRNYGNYCKFVKFDIKYLINHFEVFYFIQTTYINDFFKRYYNNGEIFVINPDEEIIIQPTDLLGLQSQQHEYIKINGFGINKIELYDNILNEVIIIDDNISMETIKERCEYDEHELIIKLTKKILTRGDINRCEYFNKINIDSIINEPIFEIRKQDKTYMTTLLEYYVNMYIDVIEIVNKHKNDNDRDRLYVIYTDDYRYDDIISVDDEIGFVMSNKYNTYIDTDESDKIFTSKIIKYLLQHLANPNIVGISDDEDINEKKIIDILANEANEYEPEITKRNRKISNILTEYTKIFKEK